MQRGQLRLDRFVRSFKVRGDLPRLDEAIFEDDTRSWLLIYKGDGCMVMIIVDRCHGDDIGGTTACK